MRIPTKPSITAIVTITLALSGSLFAAPRRAVKVTPSALAIVNGEPVTDRDLLAIFTDRHSGHANFLGGEGEARSFLSIVIDDRLLVQEAYTLGLDKDELVTKAVRELEDTRARDLLVKREIDAKAVVTADDVKGAYEKLRFGYDVRQIAVNTRAEAEEVRAALLAGADIDNLARTCSIAASRMKGGNIKTSWGPYGDAWEKVVFALEPGEISPVIETADGFEVVQLVDRVPLTPPALEEVRSYMERTLADRKLAQRKRDFSNELWVRYHVQRAAGPAGPRDLAALLTTAPETVLANWDGGGTLLLKDLASRDELEQWANLPPANGARAVEERIRVTVNDALAIREARARNLDADPEVADAVAKYQDYLAEAVLYRDHIFKDLKVPDDEARKYFDEHRSSFTEPEQRRVAHIMTTSLDDAQKAMQALESGTAFADAAKKFSRDFATAHSGGDLGWVTPDKVPPLFKQVLTMAAGQHTKPIQSGKNWHIVALLEVKPGRTLDFDEAAPKAREQVLDAAKKKARAFWVDKLRASATIEIRDAAIKKFVSVNQLKTLEGPSVQHSIPAGELAPPGGAPHQ